MHFYIGLQIQVEHLTGFSSHLVAKSDTHSLQFNAKNYFPLFYYMHLVPFFGLHLVNSVFFLQEKKYFYPVDNDRFCNFAALRYL